MQDYEGWNREQLLALVKAQDEEFVRKEWSNLGLLILFFIAGSLCSWVLSCYMMK